MALIRKNYKLKLKDKSFEDSQSLEEFVQQILKNLISEKKLLPAQLNDSYLLDIQISISQNQPVLFGGSTVQREIQTHLNKPQEV
ncbi:hypothetical protein MSHRCOH1_03390 [Candidatus Ornithobacterium hominis]|nr:hypothetical protein MSHRCOH1_03390 [Candidatus Ornithobacterium hominis]